MSKISILHLNDDKSFYSGVAVLLDDNEYFLNKNEILTSEVENGNHHIKIFGGKLGKINSKGASVNRTIWADLETNINSDKYYLFKAPVFDANKGKLKEVTKEKFEKKKNSNSFWASAIGRGIFIAILLIIVILMSIFN